MEQELESQGMDLRVLSQDAAVAGTVARTGTTATITKASHGLEVGDRLELVTPVAVAGERVSVVSTADGGFVVQTESTGSITADTACTYKPLLSIGPRDIQGPSGSAAEIDATNLTHKAKRIRMGLPDEGQVSCNVNYVPGNVAHETLRAARKARKAVQIEMAFADDPTSYWSFDAYVLGFAVSAGVDALLSGAVTLRVNGEITEY